MRGRGAALLIGMRAGQARAEAATQQQQQAAQAQQQAYEKGRTEAQQAAPPASAPPPAPPAGGQDLTAQLQNLASLHSQGVLSDEEYAAAKKKLLG
ncbi:MAG: SHOCT domain-containing protein [Methanomassiliicoccus sp.]|nr:SHOCT domain-containing protein [Methanomassiliicoccus sp.]